MALSGSKNYTATVTAADIVALALRRLGVLDPAETIDATEQANAMVALNLLIKEWSAYDLGDWLRQTGVLFITDPGDKAVYSLGPSGDSACTAWYETEVSLAAVATDTTVTLALTDDGTHVTDNSIILIKLDDGSLHATDINDGSISASTADEAVTITTAFPSAAAVGNRVYVYNLASQINRPKRMLFASRLTVDTTNESGSYTSIEGTSSDVELIGYEDYRRLSQKFQVGPPTQAHYEAAHTNGKLYIWPTGDTSDDYDKIELTYTVYPDDFDATTDNAQFPPEWFNALAWGLAAELASEYGIPEQTEAKLWSIARSKLHDQLDYNVEGESVRWTFDSEVR